MRTLNQLLSSVFNISEDSINDQTSPENVETWDSFNALMLVTELEENFKVKFTMEEISSVKNVGDIKKVLAKYHVKI